MVCQLGPWLSPGVKRPDSALSRPARRALFCAGTDNSTRFVADTTRPSLVRQGYGQATDNVAECSASWAPATGLKNRSQRRSIEPLRKERTQGSRPKLRRPAHQLRRALDTNRHPRPLMMFFRCLVTASRVDGSPVWISTCNLHHNLQIQFPRYHLT